LNRRKDFKLSFKHCLENKCFIGIIITISSEGKKRTWKARIAGAGVGARVEGAGAGMEPGQKRNQAPPKFWEPFG